MKKLLLLIGLLGLMASCDSPQRTRAPGVWINGNSLENPYDKSGPIYPVTTTGSTSGVTSGTNSGTNTGAPGFETCGQKAQSHNIDVGHFTICQSTLDETQFKFVPTLTSSSSRVCLIPTYKDSTGSSTYIGQPQCTYTTSNQVVEGKLYKNRTGFSTYPINGVIIMKEPLLPEYIACMQAYSNWPASQQCPYGARTSSSCDLMAKNYMAQVCNTFKSKYSNSYSDIRTR